jgi:serine/threonine protein kinase/Flp pilus assembly protein TadD
VSDQHGPTLDWGRIQEVFHGALELEGSERIRYLESACAGQPTLRTEVDSLLAHATEGLLGEPVDGPPEAEFTAMDFGEYHILRPLGRGGMGNVFLAERTRAGYTQRVALKLLRPDLFHPLGAAPGLEERFARERQILARLEHPGIARLIDGGYGAGGRPYLAMEYVEGDSLSAFVEKRQLDIEARIELFIAVCDAVHYAHQRLVIHRDLKPSNIVIPESGEPKLLDFGIATLVEPEPEAGPAGEITGTRTGLWFTPSYASPEQVRRERVTILSDVYSLGVLLYELLSGQRPYDIRELTPTGIERVVCGQIPERPSTRAGSAHLARRLRGDLDTIVLKAIAKEPARRYRSAQDLAEDLRRHLDHEPVSARPDSLGYRMRTFARRNRAAVTGAVLVLGALLAGLVTTGWQAGIAREALQESQEVTDFLIGLFQQTDPTVAPVDPAFAAMVLERGAARIEELRGRPEVQARLLDALGLLFVNLGRREEAHQLIQRGFDIRRKVLGEGHPDCAISLQHLARLDRIEGRYAEAEQRYRRALDILRRKRGIAHPDYTEALSELAFLMPYLSRTPEADSLYREVLTIRQRTLPPGDPAIANALLRVAATQRAMGRLAPAESLAREALTLRQQTLGPLHPQVGQNLVILADILTKDSTRWAEAESAYVGGVSLQRRALGDKYIGLVHGLGNLAELLSYQHRYAEAESLARRTLEIRTANLGPDHPSVWFDRAALANIWAAQGRLVEAIAFREEAAAYYTRTFGPNAPDGAGNTSSLGMLYLQAGRLDAAEAAMLQALEIRRRLHGTENNLIAREYAHLGKVSLRRGKFALAEQRLRESLRIFTLTGSAEAGEVEEIRRDLAAAHRGLERPEETAR